jgi:hypothetical protein
LRIRSAAGPRVLRGVLFVRLAGSEAQQRFSVPVQVVVDESGDRNQPGFMVMAGLIAHAHEWADFSEHWQRALDEEPRVPMFKARDAKNMTGPFRHLTEHQRDLKLLRLAGLITQFGPMEIYTAIDLQAFEEVLAPVCRQPLAQPYFWLYHAMTISACQAVLALEQEERFSAVFDERKIGGERVRRWYGLMVDLLQPHEQAVMPTEPRFESDSEFLPLQASDLMAFLFREGLKPGGAETYMRMRDMVLPNILVSEHTQIFRRDRLVALAKRVTSGSMQGISASLLRKHGDLLGMRHLVDVPNAT